MDGSHPDYRALAEFRFVLRRFLAFSEDRAKEAGLNPQQHQLLLALRGFAPEHPTIAMLAARLVLKHHSTVELVDRLERGGFVKRVRAEEDRRQARVHITKRGESLLKKLSLAHSEELRRAGPELIDNLLNVLEHVRAEGT